MGHVLKIPAWEESKVNNRNVIDESQKRMLALTNECNRKNSELVRRFQKYNGRVVLRGDAVTDDSSSF